MSTATLNCPAAQTYQEVEQLIFRICHTFQARYGGEWEELVAGANLGFIKAYRTHDPEKAKFTTHLWWKVWRSLQDTACRSKFVKLRRDKVNKNEITKMEQRQNSFDLPALLHEVSDDAKAIINLTIDAPGEMLKWLPAPSKRNKIAEMLCELGWTSRRVLEGFQEIREAICS